MWSLAGKRITILWRRYEAFGGWLGHLFTFRPGALGDKRDEAGRPWFLLMWTVVLGIVAVSGAVTAADHQYSFSARVLGVVISLSAVFAVLGVALGVRAGYVLYVPDSEAPTTSSSTGSVAFVIRRGASARSRCRGRAHSGSRLLGPEAAVPRTSGHAGPVPRRGSPHQRCGNSHIPRRAVGPSASRSAVFGVCAP